MWTCFKCGEQVEDNFTACWNCQAGRDGALPENPLPPHMVEENRAILGNEVQAKHHCLRWRNILEYAGPRRFHMNTNWGALGELGELFLSKEHLEMFSCPQCGHVEFFVPSAGS